MGFNRRQFLQASAAGLGSVIGLGGHSPALAQQAMRVVVIGGGFAGATVAKYLRLWGKNIDVTLIEPNEQFVSCPLSNLVIGGSRTLSQLTHGYKILAGKYGIRMVHAKADAVDAEQRMVTAGGTKIPYDRLVLAPGIDFRYDQIEGMESEEARWAMPHAWKAGEQTLLLRRYIESMPSGGTLVISIPRAPFRCPPGPYERACQAAFFMRHAKPKAKVLVLDANPDVLVKGNGFRTAWEELYPGLIEYVPNSPVVRVDHNRLEVHTELDTLRVDVANIIPAQRAGTIAGMAGVTNVAGLWCDVNPLTYESTAVPGIHVLGDSVFADLPKSAHIANAQAKVCASAIAAMESGIDPLGEPVFANTCYSFVNASAAMHVANVYRYNPVTKKMQNFGGGDSGAANRFDAYYARAWAMNIWTDTLG